MQYSLLIIGYNICPAQQLTSLLGRLILMFNKNSGGRTTFYHSKTPFLLLFILQISLSQVCLQYSGSDCIQCASGFQLVSGGCVSTVSSTTNPILIFMDIPGVQKVLYSVNPVLLTASNSTNTTTQTQQNVVSEYQVVKVNNSGLGNYYEVRANTTSAVGDVNKLLANSSLLKETNQTGQKNIQNGSLADNSTNSSGLSIVKQENTNASNVQDATPASLTAIKQASQNTNNTQLNLITIKEVSPSSPNFTLIQQNSPTSPNLTVIKQAAPPSSIEPSFTPIKQTVTEPAITPIQVKEANATSSEANLTGISIKNQSNISEQQSNINSSNQNNSDLLLQLQQISQKLTQASQVFTLTQAKVNQQDVSTPVSLTQVGQNQQPSQNGGAITIQLTQVGQQLTQVNQQLTQAKLAQSTAVSNETLTANITVQATTTLSPSSPGKTGTNQTKITLNISQFQLPPQTQVLQNVEPNLTAANHLVDINWIQATRYELHNLTLVPQALTQAKMKQSSNTSLDTTLTFKCSTNITLFIPPTITPQSNSLEVKYVEYASAISSNIAKQLQEYTQADRSTLCLDPPFHRCIKHLNEKHKAIINNLPLFAVYYQYCGFAKTFRVFFLDDSSLPNITIYEGEVVVDLYRMAPAEVFFTAYNSSTLQ